MTEWLGSAFDIGSGATFPFKICTCTNCLQAGGKGPASTLMRRPARWAWLWRRAVRDFVRLFLWGSATYLQAGDWERASTLMGWLGALGVAPAAHPPVAAALAADAGRLLAPLLAAAQAKVCNNVSDPQLCPAEEVIVCV